jgi:hypothetical protein
MFVDWTKHLKTPEEKSRFENQVQSAKPVLDRLIQLIKEKTDSLDLSETREEQFDNPNWAHKQAYKNGLRSATQGFTKLIDLDQQRI